MSVNHVLPGIPLVNSPLFPELKSSGAFGRHVALAEQLHTQGFAVLDLGRDRVGALASEIRDALHEVLDLTEWRASGGRLDRRIQDAWQTVRAVKALALDSMVLEVLEALWGRKPFAFQTLNFPVGTQQDLHSDAVHFHSEPAGFMCGVWVAMEDIYPDAGPLEYVPKSHRLPFLQARDVGYRQQPEVIPYQEIFHAAWREMIYSQGLRLERFTPRQGEALIWAANLIHGGSNVQDLSLTRWSQVTHYFFEGCLHYTPMLSNWPLGPVAWRQPWNINNNALYSGNWPGEQAKEHLAEEIKALQGFDPVRYLEANQDVARSGMNAYEHLIRYGIQEKRVWSQ